MASLRNKLHHLISGQIPDYVRDTYPLFVLFLEDYYKFLEESKQANDILLNTGSWTDIDNTIIDFLPEFKKQFAADIPDSAVLDIRRLIKIINEFYEAKGTENGTELFFRFMFNDQATVKYPGDFLLTASGGTWKQGKSFKIDSFYFNDPNHLPFEMAGNVVTISYDVYENGGAGVVTHEFTVPCLNVTKLSASDIYKVDVEIGEVPNFPYNAIGRTAIGDIGNEAYNSHIYMKMGDVTYGTLTKQLVSVNRIIDGGTNFRIGESHFVNEGDNTEYFSATDPLHPENWYTEFVSGVDAYVLPTDEINDAIIRIRDLINVKPELYFEKNDDVYGYVFDTEPYTVLSLDKQIKRIQIITTGQRFTVREPISEYIPPLYFGEDYVSDEFLYTSSILVNGSIAVDILNADIIPRVLGTTANVVFDTGYLYTDPGHYVGNSGLISDINRLPDNFFYQPYSYVVRSQQSMESWQKTFIKNNHPAGFVVFGNLEIPDSVESLLTIVDDEVDLILVSPSPTPTPSITITPTHTPTVSATPTVTTTPSVTPTSTPTVTPTVTTSVSITPTITPSITTSVTPTETPSTSVGSSVSATPSVTPSITVSTSVTPSVTPSITASITPSVSITPSKTPSVTPSISPSISLTPAVTPSVTPSITASITPSVSITPSKTPSVTPSITVSNSITPSVTPSITLSPISVTPSVTPSITISPSVTPPPPTPSVTPSTSTFCILQGAITGPAADSATVCSFAFAANFQLYFDGSQYFTDSNCTTIPTNGYYLQDYLGLPKHWVDIVGGTLIAQNYCDPSPTPTRTITPTVTPSISISATPSITPSISPSISISGTPSVTPTPSITLSITPTVTPSLTPTPSTSSWCILQGAITGPAANSTTVCGFNFAANFQLYFDGSQYFTDASCSVIVQDGYYLQDYLGAVPSKHWVDFFGGTLMAQNYCNPSPSATPSISVSKTPSVTPSLSISSSLTPTVTPSISPSISITPTRTPSVTPSLSVSSSPPVIPPSVSVSPSPSSSIIPASVSVTPTPSSTPAPTPSPSKPNCTFVDSAAGPHVSSISACVDSTGTVNIYTSGGLYYADSGCTLFPDPGYYHMVGLGRWYRFDTTGGLISSGAC